VETETIAELHKKAMDFAANAAVSKDIGDGLLWRARAGAAYHWARKAAGMCLATFVPEPTRSEYLRDAANLAVEVGEWVEAYHLVAAALIADAVMSGQPIPRPLDGELCQMLDQIEAHWQEMRRKQNGGRGMSEGQDSCLECCHGRLSPKGVSLHCKAFKIRYNADPRMGKCVYYSPWPDARDTCG